MKTSSTQDLDGGLDLDTLEVQCEVKGELGTYNGLTDDGFEKWMAIPSKEEFELMTIKQMQQTNVAQKSYLKSKWVLKMMSG